MANSEKRKENIAVLDPNRFKEAKLMSTVPGGPMNNYPPGMSSFIQPSSLSGVNQFPYGDSGMVNPPQLGGVFPTQPSGMPQQMAVGTRLNQTPYGSVPTPDPQTASFMTGAYAYQQAQAKGLFATALGPTGMPSQMPQMGMGPMDMLANSMTLPPQGTQSAEVQAPQKGTSMRTGKRGKA